MSNWQDQIQTYIDAFSDNKSRDINWSVECVHERNMPLLAERIRRHLVSEGFQSVPTSDDLARQICRYLGITPLDDSKQVDLEVLLDQVERMPVVDSGYSLEEIYDNVLADLPDYTYSSDSSSEDDEWDLFDGGIQPF